MCRGNNTIIKIGGYINQIICGDCLDIMPNMPDKSIDMILCDLPYGTTTCSWDTIIPFDKLWEQYMRISKYNSIIILTASQPFTSKLVMSNIEMFKYEWIWEKDNGSNPLLANINPMKVHENILIFQNDNSYILKSFGVYIKEIRLSLGLSLKDMGNLCNEKWYHRGGCMYFETGLSCPTYQQYENIKKVLKLDNRFDNFMSKAKFTPQMTIGKKYITKAGKSILPHLKATEGYITKNEGLRFPRSVLKINSEKGLHPTQKPVALFEYLIKTYTNEGDLVLDNCAGSGTTGVACKNLGRNYILIEKEEKYVEIARRRVNATPEPLFV